MREMLLVLMEALVHQKKSSSINFRKAKTKYCLSLHYNGDNSYLFVNEKEICKFKASNKNVNFTTQFCLGSISNKFDYEAEAEFEAEVSLKGNVYDLSIDYKVIDKSDILNIHKYLMNKNGIVYIKCLDLLRKYLSLR